MAVGRVNAWLALHPALAGNLDGVESAGERLDESLLVVWRLGHLAHSVPWRPVGVHRGD